MTPMISITIASIIVYAVFSTYRNRLKIYRLQTAGYPMPKWNWVFGHLLVLKEYTDRYPSDSFIPFVIRDMAKEFADTDLFYLDLWPFTAPVLCVADGDIASQAATKHPFPKADSFNVLFEPIMGGPNLLSMNDREWREWRGLFNPGFGSGYMLQLVPAILTCIETFKGKLEQRVDTVFCLEELITRMTMDIIVKVTLDDDMNYQNGPNPLADSLRAMISWTSFGNFVIRYNPTRPLIMRYYGRIINKYVQRALKTRWAEIRSEKNGDVSKRSKSAISLALEAHRNSLEKERKSNAELDPRFAAYAEYQIRLFMFAGHDTTSGMLVYTYHMLATHPDALRRVQDEHTAVFGSLPAEANSMLRNNPSLVNKLVYTLAVIKETMRLYPPSGAIRDGVPGRFLTDRHGRQFPTEGVHISILHQAIHDNPRLWPRARDFLPERWLAEPGDALYPTKDAWRAFEIGPRNCIGQTLAILEIRLALVLTIRTFSIQPAYDEWNATKPRTLFQSLCGSKAETPKTLNTINGEKAYPIERGGAHPKDFYPCKLEAL